MEQKFKVHFIDRDNYGEVIKRVMVDEKQKNLLDFMGQNDLFPEWLKIEYIPEEIHYTDLT